MAITIVDSDQGVTSEFVSDTSLALTPSGNLTAGNYGILFCVCDNVGTAEGETTDISITDTPGHTWSRLREQTEANTAALTGVTCGVFMALLSSGLTTAQTVTMTLSANATSKGMRLAEVSVGGGNTLQLAASAGSNAAAATSYSAAISGLSSAETLYLGVEAGEARTVNQAFVQHDGAYTEFGGAGTGRFGTDGSPTTDHTCGRAGYLLNTSTGDTFDNTALTATDRATILVALREAAGAGGAAVVDPFGMSGFFGA